MLESVLLAIATGITTLVIAVLGVYVTLNPTRSKRKKDWYLAAFVVCGLASILLNVWQTIRNENAQAAVNGKLTDIQKNTAPVPPLKSFITFDTKELPVPSFSSHGFPTSEVYVTAHGAIPNPTFELTCDKQCFYETAQSISTGTLPEEKQLSPTQLQVRFIIPGNLADGQQVSIRVRSTDKEPIRKINVKRIEK